MDENKKYCTCLWCPEAVLLFSQFLLGSDSFPQLKSGHQYISFQHHQLVFFQLATPPVNQNIISRTESNETSKVLEGVKSHLEEHYLHFFHFCSKSLNLCCILNRNWSFMDNCDSFFNCFLSFLRYLAFMDKLCICFVQFDLHGFHGLLQL